MLEWKCFSLFGCLGIGATQAKHTDSSMYECVLITFAPFFERKVKMLIGPGQKIWLRLEIGQMWN